MPSYRRVTQTVSDLRTWTWAAGILAGAAFGSFFLVRRFVWSAGYGWSELVAISLGAALVVLLAIGIAVAGLAYAASVWHSWSAAEEEVEEGKPKPATWEEVQSKEAAFRAQASPLVGPLANCIWVRETEPLLERWEAELTHQLEMARRGIGNAEYEGHMPMKTATWNKAQELIGETCAAIAELSSKLRIENIQAGQHPNFDKNQAKPVAGEEGIVTDHYRTEFRRVSDQVDTARNEMATQRSYLQAIFRGALHQTETLRN